MYCSLFTLPSLWFLLFLDLHFCAKVLSYTSFHELFREMGNRYSSFLKHE